MLTPYRRHSAKCPHKTKGRTYKNCKCPIWADGVLGNREVRVSLKTRDWNEASRKVLRMQAEGQTGGPVLLSIAWDSFLADLQVRKISSGVQGKYKLLRARLEAFVESRKIEYVQDVNLDLLTGFRATWTWGPRTHSKHLERLKAFFGFCAARRWTADGNPADGLKAPQIDVCPTMPFSEAQMTKLLSACDDYEKAVACAGPTAVLNARRLRVLILVMRYTGLAISDTVKLSTAEIEGDKLFLYRQKTGEAVYTVLPPDVLRALRAVPRVTDSLYFWSGNGKLETAVKDYQGRLLEVFKLAGLSKGKTFAIAHRFRDTFAVHLLLAGVPIERVQILLGHSSVKTTQKHYSPWVKARQEQLEADLRSVWTRQEQGTKQVQKERVVPIR